MQCLQRTSAAAAPARTWARVSGGLPRGRSVHVAASAAGGIEKTVSDNKVVVYSATYCPYCSQAKGLFQKLNVPATVIETDQVAGGQEMREGLQEVTGRRTVPQVFIGGKHVGGCDDTMAAYSSGELKKMLAGVGIQI